MAETHFEVLEDRVKGLLKRKYSQVFAFYLSKGINELLSNVPCSHVVKFKEYLFSDDENEYAKRFYRREEQISRLGQLCEFYEAVFPPPDPNLFALETASIMIRHRNCRDRIFFNEKERVQQQQLQQQQQQQAQQENKNQEDSLDFEDNPHLGFERQQLKGSWIQEKEQELMYEGREHKGENFEEQQQQVLSLDHQQYLEQQEQHMKSYDYPSNEEYQELSPCVDPMGQLNMSDKSSIQQWKGNEDGTLRVGSFMQELSAMEKTLSFETESFDIYNPSLSRLEQLEESNKWNGLGNGKHIPVADMDELEVQTIPELTEDQLLRLYTLDPNEWQDEIHQCQCACQYSMNYQQKVLSEHEQNILISQKNQEQLSQQQELHKEGNIINQVKPPQLLSSLRNYQQVAQGQDSIENNNSYRYSSKIQPQQKQDIRDQGGRSSSHSSSNNQEMIKSKKKTLEFSDDGRVVQQQKEVFKQEQFAQQKELQYQVKNKSGLQMLDFSKNRNNHHQGGDDIEEQIRDDQLVYHQNTQATRQETEYDHEGGHKEENPDYDDYINREWKNKTEQDWGNYNEQDGEEEQKLEYVSKIQHQLSLKSSIEHLKQLNNQINHHGQPQQNIQLKQSVQHNIQSKSVQGQEQSLPQEAAKTITENGQLSHQQKILSFHKNDVAQSSGSSISFKKDQQNSSQLTVSQHKQQTQQQQQQQRQQSQNGIIPQSLQKSKIIRTNQSNSSSTLGIQRQQQEMIPADSSSTATTAGAGNSSQINHNKKHLFFQPPQLQQYSQQQQISHSKQYQHNQQQQQQQQHRSMQTSFPQKHHHLHTQTDSSLKHQQPSPQLQYNHIHQQQQHQHQPQQSPSSLQDSHGTPRLISSPSSIPMRPRMNKTTSSVSNSKSSSSILLLLQPHKDDPLSHRSYASQQLYQQQQGFSQQQQQQLRGSSSISSSIQGKQQQEYLQQVLAVAAASNSQESHKSPSKIKSIQAFQKTYKNNIAPQTQQKPSFFRQLNKFEQNIVWDRFSSNQNSRAPSQESIIPRRVLTEATANACSLLQQRSTVGSKSRKNASLNSSGAAGVAQDLRDLVGARVQTEGSCLGPNGKRKKSPLSHKRKKDKNYMLINNGNAQEKQQSILTKGQQDQQSQQQLLKFSQASSYEQQKNIKYPATVMNSIDGTHIPTPVAIQGQSQQQSQYNQHNNSNNMCYFESIQSQPPPSAQLLLTSNNSQSNPHAFISKKSSEEMHDLMNKIQIYSEAPTYQQDWKSKQRTKKQQTSSLSTSSVSVQVATRMGLNSRAPLEVALPERTNTRTTVEACLTPSSGSLSQRKLQQQQQQQNILKQSSQGKAKQEQQQQQMQTQNPLYKLALYEKQSIQGSNLKNQDFPLQRQDNSHRSQQSDKIDNYDNNSKGFLTSRSAKKTYEIPCETDSPYQNIETIPNGHNHKPDRNMNKQVHSNNLNRIQSNGNYTNTSIPSQTTNSSLSSLLLKKDLNTQKSNSIISTEKQLQCQQYLKGYQDECEDQSQGGNKIQPIKTMETFNKLKSDLKKNAMNIIRTQKKGQYQK